MPSKTQEFYFPGTDADTLLCRCYGAFEHLGWTIKYRVDHKLIAYTPRSWKRYDDEMVAEAENEKLVVTSSLVHGEAFDMMGKNKRHLGALSAALQKTKETATDSQMQQWKAALEKLKTDTGRELEQEMTKAAVIQNAMGTPGSGMHITYGLIGISVLVFVLMAVSGVDIMSPAVDDILKWGGNHPSYTADGEWWRLITCMFEHIGIIHLAFNMYALYYIGSFLEPMLGKTKYITAYMCAGILAGVVSFWWNREGGIVSAGASGAIFGMYGVFLALLTTSLVPQSTRNRLLQSILIFVGYNVFYGLRSGSGVDNSAHIGGLISGMIIGYVFFPSLRSGEEDHKNFTPVSLLSLATIIIAFFALQNVNIGNDAMFLKKYDEVVALQNTAMKPLQENQLTDDRMAATLENVSLPKWKEAEKVLSGTKDYNLSEKLSEKREQITLYVQLRIEQTELLLKAFKENSGADDIKLDEVNGKINEVLELLNKQ